MTQINLTAIHQLMTKFYGSRQMIIDTDVETKNLIKLKEIKITFDYNSNLDIDIIRLNRRLDRHICGVRNHYVSIINKSVVIVVEYYYKRKLSDYDFDFSEN